MLKLKSFSIRLIEYGVGKGTYQGEILYAGETGSVALVLSEDACKKLLPVVAEAIVATSKEVAANLTTEAMQTVKEASK